MKSTFIVLILAALSVPFFSGCYSTEVSESANVNQAQIYQNYYIGYDSESGLADARAVFRFESWQGNTLNLTPPSDIIINGKDMRGEKEWLVGYVYRADRVKNDRQEYTFEFTDTEGKKYTNRLMLKPIEFDTMQEAVSRSSGVNISWKGKPVGQDETARLVITMADTVSITLETSMRGATYITVKPDDLAGFQTGLANLQFEREVTKDLQEATNSEGMIGGKYTSGVTAVTIEE
ncbi:MAG: hypothetical protein KJ607_07105 [Bacteroidetes bacterium]|nr:hypothetical protein [Bacteroidota bacterium]